MKQAILAVTVLLFAAGGCVAQEKASELKDTREKVSYGIGMSMGKDFASQGIDVDAGLLAQGLKDALSGEGTLMTDEEAQAVLMAFQQEMMAKQQALAAEQAEKNLKEGEAFLAENGKKEGVTTLPSGLQYKVLEEGSGRTPGKDDTVEVHYRGTLIGGTEFDSSYGRGEPATFPVGRVIKGWTEALQLMKEGAKWQLVIPSSLAYGEQGAGAAIGPNSTLLFDVELLSIK